MDQVVRPQEQGIGAAGTVTLALAMLLASLGTSIANIALPALAAAFSAPFVAVQAVVVAYLAVLTVSVVVAGRLGDRYGLKPMLVSGLALFAVASLLCALAPDLRVLTAARGLQGAGAGFLMTLSLALMRETAGAARMGRAMGLIGTASALGTALGPALGGVLIPLAGWRALFWIQLPLALLALLLARATLPEAAGRGKGAPDGPRPVMTGALSASLFVNFLVAAVMMTTLVVGPFYLGPGLGLREAMVGLVMAIGPVISIASGVPSGRLVDALGSGVMRTAGLSCLAAGAALLALLPAPLGVAGYGLAIAVLTPGYQLFQAANNMAALVDVPADRRGTVSGLLVLSRNLGLIAGASVMGAVFAYGVGTAEPVHAAPAAVHSGMRLTFAAATALMIAALAISLFPMGRSGRRS